METPAKPGLLARWHHTPLYLRILGGMVLGLAVGMIFHESVGFLAIPSKLVLRILGALAPALILIAIVRALVQAKFEARLFRLLILNTVVAIIVGLVVANLVQPGRYTHLVAKTPTAEIHPDVVGQFLDNIPKSLLGPLTDEGKVLGVIFWAVAFGVAFRRSAQRYTEKLVALLDLAMTTVVVILHWIIDVVPLAVFGLVASIVGTQGFGAFRALGVFVIAVLAALFIQSIYYLVRLRFSSWVKPMQLLRGGSDALVMAFSTGSSTITMPVSYECLRDRIGVRERSASLGILVGTNFNHDGTALYEAMAALFIAQGLGTHLSLTQQLLVVFTSIIASVGAAGIPEAGLVTMALVFGAVGLPPEFIALLLPVDWFLDRCRTAINVMGDMNVSCILDGKTKHQPEPLAIPPPVKLPAAG